MHNGQIKNFNDIKKNIVSNIDSDILSSIKGNTDSEYCFGMYLTLLKKYNKIKSMIKLIDIIKNTNQEALLNFAVSNGTWYINKI